MLWKCSRIDLRQSVDLGKDSRVLLETEVPVVCIMKGGVAEDPFACNIWRTREMSCVSQSAEVRREGDNVRECAWRLNISCDILPSMNVIHGMRFWLAATCAIAGE